MALRRILWVVIIICGLAWAGVVGLTRIQAERNYNTVELIVDLEDARVLSAGSQVPLNDLLARFRDVGVGSLAIRELTLEDLVADGQVAVHGGMIMPIDFSGLGPTKRSESLYERLSDHGLIKGELEWPSWPIAGASRANAVMQAGLGLADSDVDLARQAGLGPVPRYSNTPPLDAEAIDWLCQEAKRAGARLLIFDGDQVLGYPGLIEETARCLERHGLAYGSVEFTQQRGDQALGEALGGRIVRVHSITEQEMPNMKRDEAIERFVRAVRERNMRACYLRLFLAPRPDLIEFNINYVDQLATRLREAGYTIGSAQPFSEVHRPGGPLGRAGCIALVVVAFLALLMIALTIRRRPWPRYWVILAVIVFVMMILVAARPGLARLLLPLGIALVFPTLALVAVNRWLRPTEGAPVSTGRSIGTALVALLVASGISWLGGLLLASVLTESLYMTAVRRFVGTKLALVFPILAVAAIYIADAFAGDDWQQQKRHMAQRVRAFFGAEWRVWHTLVAIAAVGAIAIALMRSGNEPGVGVAAIEMKLRSLLENLLYARPRFKEFAIGHPALMLAAALAAQRRPRWVIPLLLVGAVGQVSLVNTYEHLHTPLLLSLLRTANGLWIGAVIGIIAILIFARRPVRRSPRASQRSAASQSSIGEGGKA